jgi:hypothetical protein
MKGVPCQSWRRALAASALLFLSSSIGCTQILGPEQMPVAEVSGRVTQRGAPVKSGWIEFVPVDGTVGRMRSARLDSNGSFHATKVPVGQNLVRLVNVNIESNVGERVAHDIRQIFGAFTSPIRRTIAANRNPPLEIDLVAEYLKLSTPAPKEPERKPAGQGLAP